MAWSAPSVRAAIASKPAIRRTCAPLPYSPLLLHTLRRQAIPTLFAARRDAKSGPPTSLKPQDRREDEAVILVPKIGDEARRVRRGFPAGPRDSARPAEVR